MSLPRLTHGSKKYRIDAALVVITVVAFLALVPVVGEAAGLVSFVPTLASAWRHGRRSGLWVATAIGLVLVPALYAVAYPEFAVADQIKNVPGLVLHLLLGASVGYTRDLGWRLRAEVEERTAAQNALAASESKYRSLVDAMHEVVFRADADLRFRYLNPAWERTTGVPAESSLGHTLLDYIHADDRTAVADLLGSLGSLDAPFARGEFRLRTADDAIRWIEIHASTQADAPSQIFGTLSDITDSVRFEAEREARLQTEELLRAKNVLFTTLSHEFRTPLTGVLGFANLIVDEVEDPYREWAQSIVDSGMRLQNTLTAILDLAMLEANEVTPNLAPTDLNEAAQDVVQRFRPRAEQRGLSLNLSLPPDPPLGFVDAGFLHRVLSSLVDNALKFTHHGGVEIAVTTVDGQCTISVADTGIGIWPDFVPHLFRDFRQEREGLNRPYEGNGIGLSVTKRLVELMGGTIHVESVPHEGSTFAVHLPLCARAPSSQPAGVFAQET